MSPIPSDLDRLISSKRQVGAECSRTRVWSRVSSQVDLYRLRDFPKARTKQCPSPMQPGIHSLALKVRRRAIRAAPRAPRRVQRAGDRGRRPRLPRSPAAFRSFDRREGAGRIGTDAIRTGCRGLRALPGSCRRRGEPPRAAALPRPRGRRPGRSARRSFRSTIVAIRRPPLGSGRRAPRPLPEPLHAVPRPAQAP